MNLKNLIIISQSPQTVSWKHFLHWKSSFKIKLYIYFKCVCIYTYILYTYFIYYMQLHTDFIFNKLLMTLFIKLLGKIESLKMLLEYYFWITLWIILCLSCLLVVGLAFQMYFGQVSISSYCQPGVFFTFRGTVGLQLIKLPFVFSCHW